jgi:hypothetical protein
MNSPYQEPGGGVGWIVLLVLVYIIFNPIPGPIDDAAAVAGYRGIPSPEETVTLVCPHARIKSMERQNTSRREHQYGGSRGRSSRISRLEGIDMNNQTLLQMVAALLVIVADLLIEKIDKRRRKEPEK